MDDEDHKKKDSTTSSEDMSNSCLNPSEMAYKSYFFLFFTATGSYIPYLALYFKQLGLRASQAGILAGFRLFSEVFGAPLWGIVGDKYRARKIILFVSLLSYAAGNLLLLAFQPQNQKCIVIGANKTVIKPLIFTPEGIKLGQEQMELARGEVIDDGLTRNFHTYNQTTRLVRKVDEGEVTKIFLIFLSITFASQILGSVVFTMPDALVVGFLRENVNMFGTFRMWGEVGKAIGSFSVGGIISLFVSEVCGEMVNNYSIAFYFFAGFIALAMVNVTLMEVKYQNHKLPRHTGILEALKELLRCHNLIFIVVTCYLGFLDGLHNHFGLWYLDDLGAHPYMLGLASAFQCCLGLFGYVFSGAIINKVGLVPTLAACLFLYASVFLGLAFTHDPWLGVVQFSVQGMLHGLGWSTCAVFGGTVSLRVGFHATVQGKSHIVPAGLRLS